MEVPPLIVSFSHKGPGAGSLASLSTGPRIAVTPRDNSPRLLGEGQGEGRAPTSVTLASLPYFKLFSILSSVRIAGKHCATLPFGSRPSWIAAKNSRSISSMPFFETATPEISIGFS